MTEGRFAELISLIAHELRSPLTSVKGFSSTLLKRWDRFTDEQRLELIETIYADSERMSRIVTEVVDLARLDSGRLQLHPTLVRVGPAAATALEQVRRLEGADRVSLHVDETLEVWADPDRLGHILFNVIENAIKYSENGPIAVVAVADGDEVSISVTDAGMGIEPDRVAGVFSGPGGHGSMPSGTGLGLYLTKQLVDAHGGRISVESTHGEGSRFTIVLPARGPS